MNLVVLIIVVVLLVLGLGLLIVFLMRRSQKVVPDVADHDVAHRVVAIDDQGRPVTASQADDDPAPRDDAAFEGVLKEELEDLGR